MEEIEAGETAFPGFAEGGVGELAAGDRGDEEVAVGAAEDCVGVGDWLWVAGGAGGVDAVDELVWSEV